MGAVLIRKQIELSRVAMLRELCSPVSASREALEARIIAAWGMPAVVTLSVRSGFDAWLTERGWAEGDEVVMTGANIPDMASIVEHHGLRVRAVDFDLLELAPKVGAIAAALTLRTRAIVVTQLFGARVDLAEVGKLARERGIDLIEDAAQAYHPDYRGHPAATVSMFSFGPIKSLTALGGAVLTVRDPGMVDRLERGLMQQPVASGWAFRRRLAKYIGLCTLGRPWPLAFLDRYLRLRGSTLDAFFARSARSFAGSELVPAIQRRPSRPLLRLLARRLEDGAPRELLQRATRGEELARDLGGSVELPGQDEVMHGFWVFAVLCDNPQEVVTELRAAGFDATRQATLAPLMNGLPRLERSFARLVYLPFSPSHRPRVSERIANVVRRCARLQPNVASAGERVMLG